MKPWDMTADTVPASGAESKRSRMVPLSDCEGVFMIFAERRAGLPVSGPVAASSLRVHDTAAERNAADRRKAVLFFMISDYATKNKRRTEVVFLL